MKNQYKIVIDEKKYENFRHELHKIPELLYDLPNTTSYLKETFKTFKNYDKIKIVDIGQSAFWIDVTGEAASTGHVKGIAFRTDMDGLPLNEETGVEYTSTHPGKAHSCGHDGHMTVMTCFLEYILERLNLIPSNFNLRFLYQPAEEGGNGAGYMISKNCLQGIDEIYGLHNLSLFPVGTIGVKTGSMMAAITTFDVNITGIGGHGSAPDKCHSPITCGSEIVLKFNQITSQNIDSSKRSVVSICKFKSGETCNVIPEKAVLSGTIRSVDKETDPKIQEIMKNICEGIGKSNNCTAEITFVKAGSVTFNNDELYNNVLVPAIKKTGFTQSTENLPVMGSEDYSYFQEKIPGEFLMLGTGDSDHVVYIHNPKYNYNDLSTPYGVEMFVRILEIKTGATLIN